MYILRLSHTTTRNRFFFPVNNTILGFTVRKYPAATWYLVSLLFISHDSTQSYPFLWNISESLNSFFESCFPPICKEGYFWIKTSKQRNKQKHYWEIMFSLFTENPSPNGSNGSYKYNVGLPSIPVWFQTSPCAFLCLSLTHMWKM